MSLPALGPVTYTAGWRNAPKAAGAHGGGATTGLEVVCPDLRRGTSHPGVVL